MIADKPRGWKLYNLFGENSKYHAPMALKWYKKRYLMVIADMLRFIITQSSWHDEMIKGGLLG